MNTALSAFALAGCLVVVLSALLVIGTAVMAVAWLAGIE